MKKNRFSKKLKLFKARWISESESQASISIFMLSPRPSRSKWKDNRPRGEEFYCMLYFLFEEIIHACEVEYSEPGLNGMTPEGLISGYTSPRDVTVEGRGKFYSV